MGGQGPARRGGRGVKVRLDRRPTGKWSSRTRTVPNGHPQLGSAIPPAPAPAHDHHRPRQPGIIVGEKASKQAYLGLGPGTSSRRHGPQRRRPLVERFKRDRVGNEVLRPVHNTGDAEPTPMAVGKVFNTWRLAYLHCSRTLHSSCRLFRLDAFVRFFLSFRECLLLTTGDVTTG